ncbi:SET domain-containing protein [Pluteus cervinus]|uniref:SET domain-containing protein n=1 Tax=Pluteus cervinus TaxID=181527 RepID=A0ACD3ASK2_9AGAR|nr:SET domain-containing protein [Pluteus cervinus]
MRTDKETGRGVWAKNPYRPGDVLMTTRPYISVLSTHNLSSYCSACFGPAPPSGLKRCTQCRTIHYCSAACQTRDWTLHKRECPALQDWAKASPNAESLVPSDAVRSLARILWGKQKKGLDSIWSKEIDALQSHRKSLQPESFEVHAHLSHALVLFLGLSSPEDLGPFGIHSAGDLVDLVSRFITNTFTIATPSLTPLGACVSPLIALINHSCEPHAVVVFPRTSPASAQNEPAMQLIAIRPILPDQEVLITYVDITLPRPQRRKTLKETYHFVCNCSLCSNLTNTDPRDVLQCPKRCGGTCPIPTEENNITRCTSCKAGLTTVDEVLDAVRIGEEALAKATALQSQDPVKAKQLTTKLIPILTSAGLLPSAHPLLALSRLHQTLLLSSLPDSLTQDALDDVICAATRSSAGLNDVLLYGHPSRGICLAELGKLLAADEPQPKEQPKSQAEAALVYPPSGPKRLKLALDTLIRARSELMVGFGAVNEGGEVGKEVRESIVALEKELGVWKQGIRNVVEDMPKPLRKPL